MPRRPYVTRKPRVRIAPNGAAVLSGLHVADLDAILTAASIHNYESLRTYEAALAKVRREREADPTKYLIDLDVENAECHLAYVRRERQIIDALEVWIREHRRYRPPPVSRKERLRAAHEENVKMEKIMAAIDAEIAARRAAGPAPQEDR